MWPSDRHTVLRTSLVNQLQNCSIPLCDCSGDLYTVLFAFVLIYLPDGMHDTGYAEHCTVFHFMPSVVVSIAPVVRLLGIEAVPASDA